MQIYKKGVFKGFEPNNTHSGVVVCRWVETLRRPHLSASPQPRICSAGRRRSFCLISLIERRTWQHVTGRASRWCVCQFAWNAADVFVCNMETTRNTQHKKAGAVFNGWLSFMHSELRALVINVKFASRLRQFTRGCSEWKRLWVDWQLIPHYRRCVYVV